MFSLLEKNEKVKRQSPEKLQNFDKPPEPISDILARVMANLQRKKEVASHE